MAKPEWGAKHVCENCGLKYYDMRRNPVACPSCGEKAAIATARPRRGRNAAKPVPVTPPAASAAPVATGVAPDGKGDTADDGDVDAEDTGLLADDDDDTGTDDVVDGAVNAKDKDA